MRFDVLSVLSERELAHLKNLRNPKNRLQWISGRYAVKSAIFKYKAKERSIIDPRCLDVLKGADSAPFILQYSDMGVSITHAFPYCIGMVSDRAVGIDMERFFARGCIDKVFLFRKRGKDSKEFWKY